MNAKTSSSKRSPKKWRLILSCEHASLSVPRPFAELFALHETLLQSHRGWDIGALDLTRKLARRMEVSPFVGKTTRLLVELNRSPGHPNLFSEVTKSLSREQKEEVLARHYRPYRRAIESAISEANAAGVGVCHLSVHTFTPVLDGKVRPCDLGLLYDPRREGERQWSNTWIDALHLALPGFVIRRNYPYRGVADGLTTALRRTFPPSQYLGIELEVNQRWPIGDSNRWRQVTEGLAQALEASWPFQRNLAREKPERR